MIIIASQGKIFRRIHDEFIFSNEIHLGIDFSTGKPRIDLAEYYEEVEDIIELTDTKIFENLFDENQ